MAKETSKGYKNNGGSILTLQSTMHLELFNEIIMFPSQLSTSLQTIAQCFKHNVAA